MENKLAENIRRCRKDLGLTQDQLAERLGVTLGAVSKWERGGSEPDLGIIMDLAEIFHVSVDALIGFSMHGTDADTEAARIEELGLKAPVTEVAEEYARALKKFPNHFRIVLGAAACAKQIGIVYRQDGELKHALELYQHALELISQNKDPKIGEPLLRDEVANCYSALKDYKRAVEEYKKNNLYGNNDAQIGSNLIQYLRMPEEGIEYTERAFLNHIVNLPQIMNGFFHYNMRTKHYDRGIRAAKWTIESLQSLKADPEARSFLDKIICLCYLLLAGIQDMARRPEESQENMRTAVRIAAAFDRDPVYTLENIVFMEHTKDVSFYDSSGPTALEGLKQVLSDAVSEDGYEISEEFRNQFEREIGRHA